MMDLLYCHLLSFAVELDSLDKGEGGVKNLKTWVTSFMDGPLASVVFEHVIKKDVTTTFWIQFQSSV